MNQQITVEQLVKIMEALVPADAQAKLQSALATAHQPKRIFISESDRRWTHPSIIKLAEAACPRWSDQNFSARRWLEAASDAIYKLREAHSETALAFLLRKGIQTMANDWYNTVDRDWQEYSGTSQSGGYAEWYAPLYGSVVAGRVNRGDPFPEGKVIGEESVLVNYKFGMIESFDRELFDDDQTGQIRQRASKLGASMAITESAYAAIRFIGAAGSYANLSVPVSGYSTTDVAGNTVTGPWSATLYGTTSGEGNRPGTYAALGLNVLKNAWSRMLNAKDPQGNKIITRPDILLVSNMDALHAPLLVSPPNGVPYYPAPIGSSGQTAATAVSGFPGGAFGANPFMGLGIKVVVARFLADWAWALGEKGKGFIFQERDPLEVIQESAATGAAFQFDAMRYRSRRRFEADWIAGGSRFWYLGNDGSVAGAF